MGWRQRVKLPVAVPRQQDKFIFAIDPPTLHVLSKLVIEVAKILATKSTPVIPTVPEVPVQQVVPGGSLTVSFGTITITSGNQMAWTSDGTTTIKGDLIQAFVANNVVYCIGTDNNYYRHAGDFTGIWVQVTQAEYQALRAAALKIITPPVSSAPSG